MIRAVMYTMEDDGEVRPIKERRSRMTKTNLFTTITQNNAKANLWRFAGCYGRGDCRVYLDVFDT